MPNAGEELDPNQVPPVGEDERLYRRLLTGGWYKAGKINPIPIKFFLPRAWISPERQGDFDGLSVSRAMLTTLVAASTRRDTGERLPVAEFGVGNVHHLGLTVVAKPDESDLSHALIPELNSLSQRDPATAVQMNEWAMALRNSSTLHEVSIGL